MESLTSLWTLLLSVVFINVVYDFGRLVEKFLFAGILVEVPVLMLEIVEYFEIMDKPSKSGEKEPLVLHFKKEPVLASKYKKTFPFIFPLYMVIFNLL